MSCMACGGNLLYGCTCEPLAPPTCYVCRQPIQSGCCWTTTADGPQTAHAECLRGEHLQAVRVSLGLTQSTLAAILGVHAVTISQWERGKSVPTPWCLGLLSVFATIQEPKAVGSRAASLLYRDGTPRALYELLRWSVVAERCDKEEESWVRNGPAQE